MATVTDSFSGTGSLAASWVRSDNGTPGYSRDNGVRSASVGLSETMYRNDAAFSGDQYAQIEVGVNATGEWGIGPAVKGTLGSDACYLLQFQVASRIWVRKMSTGATLIDVTGLSITVGSEIMLTAEASGADLLIKAWLNGVQVGSTYTDTSPLTGTRVGMGTYYADSTYRGINFEGGDLGATVPVLSSPSGSVTSNTAATITASTDTLSDGTMHFLRRTGGSAASAATIISTGESQATSGSNPQSKSVALLGGTANQYVDIAQDGTAGDSNVVTVGPLTTATTLSAPTGTATGNTTATVGFTTDRAVSAAFPAYFLTLPAADSPPADAAALIANGATVNQTTGGTTPTRALTGLTTATAYRTHMCQPGSNVVSSASYTPSTLTYSGTIGPQGGVQGSAHVWSGAAPSTLVSGGIGTKSWSGTGLGASGLTVNATSGQLQGTYGTPGTYNITLTCTDQSTAGTNPTGGGSPPQTVVSNTFTLTITATGSPPTVATNPNNLTVTDGATASFTASFNGSPIPSLQWQEFIGGVWTAMSGETGNVLALGTVTLTDSGRSFRLGGTNTAGGPVYTASATLTVTPAVVGTITSDIFAGWGGATPIASTTIQFVTIERVSTGAITLQLTNQVTGTDGRLIVTNAAITPGVEYMLWCRNTAGTIRGGKKYTAT
jgi:hypothetical protein